MATTVKVMSEQKRARYSAEYRAEALASVSRPQPLALQQARSRPPVRQPGRVLAGGACCGTE